MSTDKKKTEDKKQSKKYSEYEDKCEYCGATVNVSGGVCQWCSEDKERNPNQWA